MGVFNEHQYTSITAIIDQITAQTRANSDDAILETELPGLLDIIRLQKRSGQVEAARAIRKKLKYGNVSEQLNGLSLVELLVANARGDFSAFVNDEKLLERLRVHLRDPEIDAQVKKRTLQLVVGWHNEYKNDSSRSSLYKLFGQTGAEKYMKKRGPNSSRRRSVVPNFMDDEADQSTPFEEVYESPDVEPESSSSSLSTAAPFKAPWKRHEKKASQPKSNAELDRQFKIPKIDYTKEQPKILNLIAESTTLSISLNNTLQTLPKDELSIHSVKANREFDQCRAIRRKVLRYLQLVNREELVGGLLHANDQLVSSLQKYEEASYPHGDDDEDSLADYEIDDESISINLENHRPPPPVPSSRQRQAREPSPESVVSNDPFGDTNAVENPVVWR
ncbi:unnamed protein product [Kuraishia capsulata CBS 1993]|uniref:VHS domain-containing protein n=1 Tax=Kuraishia capsulata CBS 1993 TaxID=1382522 RepID=W6MVD2_9ASCO|nr:uncharacterized protein KUCA_T00005891001 [Kuraishia capsulata CBS 1993]CDK29897.1 unnamed protein product [Kuraishia capsulata CBS 1993]